MIDLPGWPPLEPMGDARARELIQAVKPHAPRAVAAATAWLLERFPDTTPRSYAATRVMIAKMQLTPTMHGISIGNVSVPGSSGKPVVVGIVITQEGGLAITVPVEGGSQAWIEVD